MRDYPKEPLDPSSFVIVDAPSKGTFDPATLIWSVGQMAPDTEETLVVSALVRADWDGQGDVVNDVAIYNPDHPETDTFSPNIGVRNDDDQGDVVSVPTGVTSLQLNKTQGSVVISPDGKEGVVSYTVEVGSVGPGTNHQTVMTDPVPEGNTAVNNIVASVGTAKVVDGKLIWAVGDMASGAVGTVTFDVTYPMAVLQAGVKNTASVESIDSPYTGGVVENETLAADTDQYDAVNTKLDSEVRIHKSVVESKLVGDGSTGEVTWLVEVGAYGSGLSTSTNVTDLLPAGALTAAASDATVGTATVDPALLKIDWNLGDLPSGARHSLKVTATYPASLLREGIVNKVTVSSNEDPYKGGTETNVTVDADTDNYDAVPVSIPAPPAVELAHTGFEMFWYLIFGGLLLAGGVVALVLRRRERQQS